MELGAATGGILIPIWTQSYNCAPECAITGSELALIGSGAAVTAWMRRTMKRSAETEALPTLPSLPTAVPRRAKTSKRDGGYASRMTPKMLL
jgi:hypothetical protein